MEEIVEEEEEEEVEEDKGVYEVVIRKQTNYNIVYSVK